MSNITNAQVDAACALIPVSWFGPATRVTNVQSPQLTTTDNFTVTVPHGYGNISNVTINYNQLTNSEQYRPIIFGAVIDDWAASIPAPYGPLTRVTTNANLPVDTAYARDTQIEFSLASPYNSTKVWMTYNELKYQDVAVERCRQAVGSQALVNDLKTSISALNTLAAGMTAPHTEDDYQDLVEEIVDLAMQVGGTRLT